jgi:hypothetical protein
VCRSIARTKCSHHQLHKRPVELEAAGPGAPRLASAARSQRELALGTRRYLGPGPSWAVLGRAGAGASGASAAPRAPRPSSPSSSSSSSQHCPRCWLLALAQSLALRESLRSASWLSAVSSAASGSQQSGSREQRWSSCSCGSSFSLLVLFSSCRRK